MRNNANRELDNKEFRKIPSLQFLYEINGNGAIRNVKSKRHLKPWKTYRGYWIVGVSIKGHVKYPTIHSLVAECWIGEKPDGKEIDHIDRNKDNNNWKNLRYVTHRENNLNRNMQHSIPVEIKRGEVVKMFRTSQECAKYIASEAGKPYGGIRNRLFKRRHFIHGYEITYLHNEETEYGNPKG